MKIISDSEVQNIVNDPGLTRTGMVRKAERLILEKLKRAARRIDERWLEKHEAPKNAIELYHLIETMRFFDEKADSK